MARTLCIVAGILLLILGLISLVSPIPGSTFFTASGMTLLICVSPWFRRCIYLGRGRLRFFNKVMTFLEEHTGQRIGDVLKKTRPTSAAEAEKEAR